MTCPKCDRHFIATSRWSYFAHHPHEFTPEKSYFCKIPLTRYCKFRKISKIQARRYIRLKWLAITRFKAQIWVHEICPEKIREDLELCANEFPDWPELLCLPS